MQNNQKRLKRGKRLILGVAICLMLLIVPVAAYEIIIQAPLKVQRGMPLVVTGTSNLPPGISVDIVLYRSEYITEEVDRQTITLQGEHEFSVVFDTKELIKGQYKVEVPGIAGYSYLGDSVTIRVVEIIDRSDEITFRSQLKQEMNGILDIKGYISNLRNAGVQIEVVGQGDQVVYGPEYIPTLMDGSFSKEVSITETGTYYVSFTDATGYIGIVTIQVTPKLTPIPTTTVPTTAQVTVLSATASATNDNPAYFAVNSTGGDVRIYTSSGVDWVIEYTDDAGVVHKINEKGKVEAEETVVKSSGGTLYFKVYPYRLSASGEVTLFTEGATSIEAGVTSEGSAAGTTTPTTEAPIGVILPVLAIGFLMVWIGRRH